MTDAPRFALVLLVDDVGACPELAAMAEGAGFVEHPSRLRADVAGADHVALGAATAKAT